MKLVYAGISLIFLGIIILAFASISSTTLSSSTGGGFAGIVFLGPIPIVFGAGNSSQLPYLFLFGIIFTILALIFFLLPWIISRKTRYP